MILKRLIRPSAGFWVIVGSYGLLAAFLGWGFSTPRLDQAHAVLERMDEPAFAGLRADEVDLLETTLERHPEFAAALIGRSRFGHVEPTEGGWTSLETSHLLILPMGPGPIRVTTGCRGGPGAFPVTLTFKGARLDRRLRFEQPGQKTFDLPRGYPKQPLWVQVTLASAKPSSAGRAQAEIDVDAEPAVPGRPTGAPAPDTSGGQKPGPWPASDP